MNGESGRRTALSASAVCGGMAGIFSAVNVLDSARKIDFLTRRPSPCIPTAEPAMRLSDSNASLGSVSCVLRLGIRRVISVAVQLPATGTRTFAGTGKSGA